MWSTMPSQDTAAGLVEASEIPTNQTGLLSLTSWDTMVGTTAAPTDQNPWVGHCHWEIQRWGQPWLDQLCNCAKKWWGRLLLPGYCAIQYWRPQNWGDPRPHVEKLCCPPQLWRSHTTRQQRLPNQWTFLSMGPLHCATWQVNQSPLGWFLQTHTKPLDVPTNHADMHSPVQTVDTGVDNQVLQPPPPTGPRQRALWKFVGIAVAWGFTIWPGGVKNDGSHAQSGAPHHASPRGTADGGLWEKGCSRYYVSTGVFNHNERPLNISNDGWRTSTPGWTLPQSTSIAPTGNAESALIWKLSVHAW